MPHLNSLRLTVLAVLLACLTPSAWCITVPGDQRAMTLQGVLTRDGVPLNGYQLLQFRIYDSPVAGQIVFSTQQKCWLSDGRFNAILEIPELVLIGQSQATPAFTAAERWWSVAVIQLPGGDGLVDGGAVEELPRQPLTAVPQALMSRRSAGVQASRVGDGPPDFVLEAANPAWGEFNEGASLYLSPSKSFVVRKMSWWVGGSDPRITSEVVCRITNSGSYWSKGSISTAGDITAEGRLEVEGAIFGAGNISGKTVTVRGADLAEGFDVAAVAGPDSRAIEPEPGLIVSIDPDRPGKLKVSSVAYDRRVAGAISGANGVEAGVLLGASNGQPYIDGPHPVAMAGRVWVHADESAGEIVPGDRLTTSGVHPGRAMRVTDESRAPGAVVGKAMTKVDPDTGMVLVLVNLQ